MTISRNEDGTYSLHLGPWVSGLFVALFMFLLAQSIIALRWGASLDSRVGHIETVMAEMKTGNKADGVENKDIQIRLVRVEERVTAIYDILRRATAGPAEPVRK